MTFSPKIKLIQDFWIIIEKVKNKKRTFRQKCDILAYLLKPRTSQNKPKPVGTTQKSCETTRNHPKSQNWGNSNFSTSFHFSNFEPKCRNLGILGKEVPIFQPFNEILPAPYFENADFKSGIGFQKFWAKIPKYGHYGSKNTNFLTLARFCLYDISEVLVSNLTFASCGC